MVVPKRARKRVSGRNIGTIIKDTKKEYDTAKAVQAGRRLPLLSIKLQEERTKVAGADKDRRRGKTGTTTSSADIRSPPHSKVVCGDPHAK